MRDANWIFGAERGKESGVKQPAGFKINGEFGKRTEPIGTQKSRLDAIDAGFIGLRREQRGLSLFILRREC